jgi:hypothetical protein
MDALPDPSLMVVSACAGQGHDLLDVLARRQDSGRVQARLIEADPRNVAAARTRADRALPADVTVMCADAGVLSSYVGAVPADLVLLAGVLGNISDADVPTTIETLPQLCAAGATVIWTRSRRPPDLTPSIRRWLADAAFSERAFHAPDDVMFTVGVHQFCGDPKPLSASGTMFRFDL